MDESDDQPLFDPLLGDARRARGVLLIGGVSGTGKSTIADLVALQLGITRVLSTDLVRAGIRELLPRTLHPEIHAESFDVPWLGHGDVGIVAETAIELAEQVTDTHGDALPLVNVVGFSRQAGQVLTSLAPIVAHCLDERWPAIIEGVHLLPGAIDQLHAPTGDTTHVLLVVGDETRHRAHFCDRGENSSRAADHYLANFTRIRALQDRFVELAHQHGVPIVDASEPDAVNEVVALAPLGLRR